MYAIRLKSIEKGSHGQALFNRFWSYGVHVSLHVANHNVPNMLSKVLFFNLLCDITYVINFITLLGMTNVDFIVFYCEFTFCIVIIITRLLTFSIIWENLHQIFSGLFYQGVIFIIIIICALLSTTKTRAISSAEQLSSHPWLDSWFDGGQYFCLKWNFPFYKTILCTLEPRFASVALQLLNCLIEWSKIVCW